MWTPRFLVLSVTVCAWAHAGDFHLVRTEGDGLVLETRSTPGSDFPEVRVRARAHSSPTLLANAIWDFGKLAAEVRLIEKRLILEDGPTSRLVWQVTRPPLVSRREAVLRFSRHGDGEAGFTIEFQSEDLPAPEHLPDAVRVPLVRGSWRFVPDGKGGCTIIYTCLSEPGGGVPAWLSSGPQQDLALAMVRDVVALAQPQPAPR